MVRRCLLREVALAQRVLAAVCCTVALFVALAGDARSVPDPATISPLVAYPMTETLAAAWGKPASGPAPADPGHTGGGQLLGPIESFEGIRNAEQLQRGVQPDAEGDVGQDNYVEWVNTSLAVYDKRGNRLLGPVPGSVLWKDVPSPCAASNLGDPIVLYDEVAGRWLLSQYATQAAPERRYFQCFALSSGPDPTGSYTRYVLEMPRRQQGTSSIELFNDYTKLAVWRNLYVITDVQRQPSSHNPAGAGVFALDRSAMLAGGTARAVYFDLPGEAPLLPSDLDGRAPPPGDPLLVQAPDATGARAGDELTLRRLHVVFGGVSVDASIGPAIQVGTAQTFPALCPARPDQCVPQQGTDRKLDAIADRAMFRAAYRSLGGVGRLVVVRTVGVGSPPHAALRWYEIADTGSLPSLIASGTYRADDASFRWMGSAALDARGNIGLGFSRSDSASYPSIGYSGVSATSGFDPGEGRLAAGGAVQTEASGWGDYSSLSVDPVDRCSFWYTQEYYPGGEPAASTGQTPWHTRIGSFRFPGCGATPQVVLTAGTPAREGTIATADPGDWSDVPGVTLAGLAYEWRRCGADGGGCAPIPGATGSTYSLTSSDVDSTIRVAVRAASPIAGVASSLSAPTGLVAPIPATRPVRLAVTAATSSATVALGSSPVVYTIRVSNTTLDATATGVALAVTPPAGSSVISAVGDRGPGCGDSTARPVVCDLDFLPSGRTATVTVRIEPNARGRLEVSATARADQAPPTSPVSAAVTVTSAPILRIAVGARLTRPARGPGILSARIDLDEPATVTARVTARGSSARLPLLPGSRLGATVLTAKRTSIAAVQPSGDFGFALRIPRDRVRPGGRYEAVLDAVDADGLRTTFTLRFRAPRGS